MFTVVQLLHSQSEGRAYWFLSHHSGDLMNWLFNVKQLRIRFYPSASRISKAGWWHIVGNAAMFSDICWHDAGLGFHDDVCHLRAVLWQALQQQVWLLWVSRAVMDSKQWVTALPVLPPQADLLRLKASFLHLSVSGSVEVFQKPRRSLCAHLPLPLREGKVKWWSAGWEIYPRLSAGREDLDWNLLWPDDLPH